MGILNPDVILRKKNDKEAFTLHFFGNHFFSYTAVC